MKRGFTLLEMIAALAVLGLLLGVAAPVILPPDRTPAAQVLASIRGARERAIRSGRPVTWRRDGITVRFLPDGSSSGGRLSAGEITLVVDPVTGRIHEAR